MTALFSRIEAALCEDEVEIGVVVLDVGHEVTRLWAYADGTLRIADVMVAGLPPAHGSHPRASDPVRDYCIELEHVLAAIESTIGSLLHAGVVARAGRALVLEPGQQGPERFPLPAV